MRSEHGFPVQADLRRSFYRSGVHKVCYVVVHVKTGGCTAVTIAHIATEHAVENCGFGIYLTSAFSCALFFSVHCDCCCWFCWARQIQSLGEHFLHICTSVHDRVKLACGHLSACTPMLICESCIEEVGVRETGKNTRGGG